MQLSAIPSAVFPLGVTSSETTAPRDGLRGWGRPRQGAAPRGDVGVSPAGYARDTNTILRDTRRIRNVSLGHTECTGRCCLGYRVHRTMLSGVHLRIRTGLGCSGLGWPPARALQTTATRTDRGSMAQRYPTRGWLCLPWTDKQTHGYGNTPHLLALGRVWAQSSGP